MRSKRTRTRPAIVAAETLPPEQPDQVLLRQVVDYYHRAIKEYVEPIAFLDKLALRDAEAIDHFHLGYSNRSLGSVLPSSDRTLGKNLRKQLVRIGIYSTSGHERYTGSLVVPAFSEEGEVQELFGRRIRDDLKPRTPTEVWLPPRSDGRRGIFNLAAVKASKELIIAAGLIDALSFWCSGSRQVTATYDPGGLHAELRAGFSKYGSTRLLLAWPRSDEGDRAAEAIAAELGTAGVEVFRIVLPLGMTANQYLKSEGPDALQTIVRAATWMRGTRPVVVPAAIEPAVTRDPQTAPTTTTAPSAAGIDAEVRDEEVVINFGDRRWRIRGLAKNTSYDSLRLNLLVSRGDAFHVDTLELYAAKQRASFLKDAAVELGVEERVLKADLGRIVLRLEELVHENIERALEVPKPFEMSEADRTEALALLKDPHLVERVLEDFKRAGVVGEETNLLVGFIAAVSRKLDAPLAVVLQSSSAAGKSSLMEAVLRFVPPEDRIQYSAMTGQSLYYLGETDLQHRILAIAEEEGAQHASYALKLLQSEGELTIASTGKEATTGKLVTHQYRVRGPVMIFLTTTAIEVDEELLNRCVVLTVDEGSKQTAAIHERQREARTLEGLFAKKDREAVVALHQNAQRLLEPLAVVNPLAKGLRFSSHSTRSRRDHTKYLALIDAIALLHQHQRVIKEVVHGGERLRYVEVTEADVALADRLAAEVLDAGVEELPPQTRRLLALIEELVTTTANERGIDRCDVRFSRKDVRAFTSWSDTALKKHLRRLEDLELLLLHSGGARRRLVYSLPTGDVQRPNLGTPTAIWSPPGHPLVTPGGCPDSSAESDENPDLVTPNREALIPGDENSARCALHAEDDP